jgi:tctex1 domain-containing protein 2
LVLDKTYSTENVKVWTKSISDDINKELCEQKNTRYKHVVQVVILEKQGQGFKMISRARWDSECDRQITESFSNDTIVCIVTVFGCYLY